jgi:ubiquinone/menaquinone biosynthesis C-methylase UbiE
MQMTNETNRRIYRRWARVYDTLTGWLFAPGRRRATHLLEGRAGECVLLVGVGTGADLPLLPPHVQLVGIDLSRDMLRHAKQNASAHKLESTLTQGDAQRLPFRDASFDAAILSLVLSVVPDGSICLNETMRVVRRDVKPSPGRRLINQITMRFGTDINRHFEPMHDPHLSTIVLREASILGGMYQIIVLKRS